MCPVRDAMVGRAMADRVEHIVGSTRPRRLTTLNRPKEKNKLLLSTHVKQEQPDIK